MYIGYYKSPIGLIEIGCDEKNILKLNFVDSKLELEKKNDLLVLCLEELDEYFLGKRKTFSVPCAFNGTEFQKSVWIALTKIPYGDTCTYKDIAINIGNPKAVRAVGGANNKNKISIILPCHRVIGSNGNLIGYGGELWRKEWLLEHEKNYL
ncbi:methylated-DNA--[protein]-cysteine S-methyltransferase [Clostridium sp. MSJ-11]|uniref:Methylated-DNA--protein-cysteine methyltransferase n=1 Tax=Clostridium mobile TaxID=2841512 RepID=A0ABS6EMI7_9CLOT|nr:methylated-DNA--[protein]-cysteine S-methyltransferase [Clostridium mobile]MBU5486342.1 methylated-DNA--[protein]-cysteine S-methyltransferase [Clostridium mobile]